MVLDRGFGLCERKDDRRLDTMAKLPRPESNKSEASGKRTLALIDGFVEEQVRRIDGDMRKLLRDLDENAGELQRLDRAMRDLLDVALDARFSKRS
jgi:hypothetical protein